MGRKLELGCAERHYRDLERSGVLKNAIVSYAIGLRTPIVIQTLARARVWSYKFNTWVPCPSNYDRTTWNDILDRIVLSTLGDRQCNACNTYFIGRRTINCFIGLGPNLTQSLVCPTCDSMNTEIIGCTKGVVL